MSAARMSSATSFPTSTIASQKNYLGTSGCGYLLYCGLRLGVTAAVFFAEQLGTIALHCFGNEMSDLNEPEDGELRGLREADSRSAELARLFSLYRPRLERMVEFRLDPRLRGRIDTHDVLQEAFLVVANRLDELLGGSPPRVTLFVWLRQLTLQSLIDLHRRHFRDKRNVGREIKLADYQSAGATSLSIAHALVDPLLSPSKAAVKGEEIEQLQQALDSMDEMDREVLALRHFEHLNNKETAEALGLSVTAASNRYVRAMARLAEFVKH